MGVSPTNKNGRYAKPFSSKFNKRKRNELQREAKAEIREVQHKLSRNIQSYSWWSNFFRLGIIIIFYFSSSIALTFYQKDLIKVGIQKCSMRYLGKWGTISNYGPWYRVEWNIRFRNDKLLYWGKYLLAIMYSIYSWQFLSCANSSISVNKNTGRRAPVTSN